MEKREKTRQGKFANAVRGRSTVIAAMRTLGWSWEMISNHFHEDVALGNASATRFSQEWSRQTSSSKGIKLDDADVASLVKELLSSGSIPGDGWVIRSKGSPNQDDQVAMPLAPPASAVASEPTKDDSSVTHERWWWPWSGKSDRQV